MVRTSWVYLLRKEELSQYLEEFALEATGSVEEMRRRLTTFITGEHKDKTLARLEELESRHSRSATPTALELPTVSFGGRSPQQPILSPGTASSQRAANHTPQMSLWSFRFDGGKDPLSFMERVEEMAEVYELNTDMLPRTMPELLKDSALLWFRNNIRHWQSWVTFRQDFLAFFLPPCYFEELGDQIRKRQQKPRETFRNYVIEMQDMMRHAGYSKDEQVERIFRNCAVDYQLYIRRNDFKTLDELIKMAENYEVIRANHPEVGREYRENHQTGPRRDDRTRQVLTSDEAPAINPATASNVHIDGIVKDATIDTVASKSYISEALARQLRGASDVRKVENRIRLANGVTVDIKEAAEAEVRLGNGFCSLEFGVMPGIMDEVLLELDFLKKMKVEIRCADQSIALETQEQVVRSIVSEPVTATQTEEEKISEFEGVEGPTTLGIHKIVLKDDRPVRQRYMQRNPEMQRRIYQEVYDLICKEYIEPSNSPKKNGTLRLYVNYRQLNAKTIPDAYPLPRINNILDRLRNAKYISSIDLKNGYWQIPMSEESKKYTAFTVAGKGLFQWKVMPFGLTSAPATFQRTLDRVIGAEMEPYAFAYLDDIVVLGGSLEEHMRNLKEVLRRLREARLKINDEKCKFFQKEIRYLGHLVTQNGIQTDPEKVAAIKDLKPPNILVQAFCTPNLVAEKGKHFRWNEPQQQAFDSLKKLLTEAPVLACPDFSKEFTLQIDACDYGIGAVLTQEIEGQEIVISYAETNYSATEKECLAIVWAVWTDKFSKWSELVPLRRATGEALQKAFRERILANFDVPKILITDNGSQFTCKSFQKYLKEIGTQQQLTAPYTQENPTERVNRTVKTMISQYVGANQKTWDELIPKLQLALNSSKSESTDYSASFIVQGREPRLPGALYDEVTGGTGTENCCPEDKAEMLKQIFSLVKNNLGKAARDQARYYNLRRRPWKPEICELVLVKEHHLSNAGENFAAKLAPQLAPISSDC
ncbi:uncharacterized protein LOC135961204 [Calliphora vicina]|uniref:uncharacterized protein LOC135961204 n=1 Tax=Calliphora vicina TaxID=7373 RepID=UPI00325BE7EB